MAMTAQAVTESLPETALAPTLKSESEALTVRPIGPVDHAAWDRFVLDHPAAQDESP
jgi:hypothetical protein